MNIFEEQNGLKISPLEHCVLEWCSSFIPYYPEAYIALDPPEIDALFDSMRGYGQLDFTLPAAMLPNVVKLLHAGGPGYSDGIQKARERGHSAMEREWLEFEMGRHGLLERIEGIVQK